jgi:hypothetical protein
MTVEWHPNPEQFHGTGTVWIAWHPDDKRYVGYWDSSTDGTPGIPLEEMPRERSVVAAVEWGRQRTPRVLVRPESDFGVHYWAGGGEPQGSDADLKPLAL